MPSASMALLVKVDGDWKNLHGEVAIPVLCFRSARGLKRRYIKVLRCCNFDSYTPIGLLVWYSVPLIMPSAMRSAGVVLLIGSVAAQTSTVTRTLVATTVFTTPGPSITAVSDCHPHSTVLYVIDCQR
jgi:hypothetical protein